MIPKKHKPIITKDFVIVTCLKKYVGEFDE